MNVLSLRFNDRLLVEGVCFAYCDCSACTDCFDCNCDCSDCGSDGCDCNCDCH